MVKQYIGKKTRSSLYLALLYLFFAIYAITQTIGMIFRNLALVNLSLVFLIIGGFFVILSVDSVSRSIVNPVKILLISLSAAFFFYTIYRPGRTITYFTGESDVYVVDPDYIVAQFLFVLINGIEYFVCFYRVHKHAPPKMKKISSINLFGTIFVTFIANLVVTLRLNRFVPAIHMVILSLGTLLTSYAFWKEPKLAFILPFKALRLSVIDTNSALSLYTYDWIREHQLVEESLLSSMIQGLSMLLDEAVNKGGIREIKLDQAFILLEQHEKYPIVCALITTRTSQILRDSLKNFLRRFIERFSSKFPHSNRSDLFVGASDLIPECFPLVPEYE